MEKNSAKKETNLVGKKEEPVTGQTVNSEKPKSKGLPLPLIIALGCLGIFIVSGIILSVAAGFFFKKVGSTLLNKGIENNTGLKIETQEGKEGISFEDKKTGAKVNLGAQKIPDNFPADFPLYPGAKPSGSLSGGQNTEKGFWLMLQSDDTLEKVETYYTANLESKGWKSEEVVRIGNSVTWKVGKGDLEGTVMVSREKDDKQTSILIILGTSSVQNQSQNKTIPGSFVLPTVTD